MERRQIDLYKWRKRTLMYRDAMLLAFEDAEFHICTLRHPRWQVLPYVPEPTPVPRDIVYSSWCNIDETVHQGILSLISQLRHKTLRDFNVFERCGEGSRKEVEDFAMRNSSYKTDINIAFAARRHALKTLRDEINHYSDDIAHEEPILLGHPMTKTTQYASVIYMYNRTLAIQTTCQLAAELVKSLMLHRDTQKTLEGFVAWSCVQHADYPAPFRARDVRNYPKRLAELSPTA
jgi:hypothetical protein